MESNTVALQEASNSDDKVAAAHENRVEALEEELQAFQQELMEQRLRVVELAEENAGLTEALFQLKNLYRGAASEREQLARTLAAEQKCSQAAQSSLTEAQAEAEAATKEARESRIALAHAKAEALEVRGAATGKALGENERKELERALKALSASALAAAQESTKWQEMAQQHEETISNQEKLLGAANDQLVLASQRVTVAEAQSLEAFSQLAKAESALQELSQVSERRARNFNSAVHAAVSKIQSALEAELDGSLQQMTDLELDHAATTKALTDANDVLEVNLSAANTRNAVLEDKLRESQIQVSQLREREESLKNSCESLSRKAEAACEVQNDLARKILRLEDYCEEILTSSRSASRNAAMREVALEEDLARLKTAVALSQSAKGVTMEELADTKATVDALSEELAKAKAELSVAATRTLEAEAQLRLRELQQAQQPKEMTLSSAQVSSGTARLHRHGNGLDDLGLEEGQEERLKSKDSFKKQVLGETSFLPVTGRLAWLRSNLREDELLLRGRLSPRSLLILAYIFILHIIVMVSFTRRTCPPSARVGAEQFIKLLPG